MVNDLSQALTETAREDQCRLGGPIWLSLLPANKSPASPVIFGRWRVVALEHPANPAYFYPLSGGATHAFAVPLQDTILA
jgi:hypothetical protein